MDFNKLWQNFVDTVTNHYLDFNGRMGRAQYWYYILVVFVLAIGVAIIASVTTRALSSLFSLALLLPNLGMTVRRLHDTGKPGIWVLLPLIPGVLMILLGAFAVMGSVLGFLLFIAAFATIIWLLWLAAMAVLIFFCAQPGQAGDNLYGPPPPVWTPGP